MRRASLQLGLGLALGLALPAAAQTGARHPHAPSTGAVRLNAGHLCPECAAELPKRVPAGTMTAAEAAAMVQTLPGCADCGGTAGGGPGLAYVGGSGEAAGYAAVGLGAAPMMAAAGEPTPIGVTRASYAHPAAMAARPAAPAYIPPPPTPMGGPRVNKSRMFGHMMMLPMPRLDPFGKAAARRRELHAAERYDAPMAGDAASLPASAVYGRGR
jgi:hypothetical protein